MNPPTPEERSADPAPTQPLTSNGKPSHGTHHTLAGLALGALGICYGDIGTSPLYTLKECFSPLSHHPMAISQENVLGILSLITWSLIILVAFKYISCVMRMNNRGEGGTLALLALVVPDSGRGGGKRTALIVAVAVFGAALLYGDGVITPAISVLSAVEGIRDYNPALSAYVLPITVAVLIGLFSFQFKGTAKVGVIFGPLMVVWFLTLAFLGLRGILAHPQVLGAMDPFKGIYFLTHHGVAGFLIMGSVFLCVTGGESLYADMGHFGLPPIRLAWFTLVMPALLLNYYGQGALLLTDTSEGAAQYSFYRLASPQFRLPLVLLATCASVVASQALISGVYSLTMQAVQLGYLPRMRMDHTSEHARGQIYIGITNWALMAACVGLVLGFKESSRLASAYGIAVTLTMLITTVMFGMALVRCRNWPVWQAAVLCSLFAVLEMVFAAANMVKVLDGGWFPLLMAAILFFLMATWKKGRNVLGQQLADSSMPLDDFIPSIQLSPPHRIKGTAIFLAGRKGVAPMALLHNLKHNQVLHERTAIMNIQTADIPYVAKEDRVEVVDLGSGFYQITGHVGFMERPNVRKLLLQPTAAAAGFKFEAKDASYYLSRESILVRGREQGLSPFRGAIFALMSRNAQSASSFFNLPAGRVVELGVQIEI